MKITLRGHRPYPGSFSYTMLVDGQETTIQGVCDDTPEAIADEIAFLRTYYMDTHVTEEQFYETPDRDHAR